ncbi:type II secretion system protein [bacterium]|nr:type II secretion system protein [bacterium]
MNISKEQRVRSKAAFTLAEVLITLGIIGVVAAMTMPAVITKYQKQVTVTKLKKVYSALSQSIELSKVEYGDIRDWDWTLNTKDFFDKYLSKKLSVIKYCAPNESGCWNSTNTIRYMYGGGSDINVLSLPRVVLSDGTFIAIIKQDNYHIHLYPDLNGVKAPNTYGKDCFLMTLTAGPYQDYVHNISQAGFYFFGQGLSQEELKTHAHACIRGKQGVLCGYKIMMDGWEIKDDYPW